MKKVVAAAVIFIFTAAGLTGCSVPGLSKAGEEGKKDLQQVSVQNPAPAAGEKKEAAKPPANTSEKKDPAAGKGEAARPEVKTDSGRYVGQIDSNFIEIKISGVPENLAARSFMLSDKVKEEFGRYGLKKGDDVRFNYIVNDKKQNVIQEIQKIGPKG